MKLYEKLTDGRVKVEFTMDPSFITGCVVGGFVVWMVGYLF